MVAVKVRLPEKLASTTSVDCIGLESNLPSEVRLSRPGGFDGCQGSRKNSVDSVYGSRHGEIRFRICGSTIGE